MIHRCLRNRDAAKPLLRRLVRETAKLRAAVLLLTAIVSGCKTPANSDSSKHSSNTLMMGVGQVTSNPQFGMQQAASLLSLEGLAIIGRDGKSRPLLAAEWTSSSDGRILRLHLRPSVKFHDGTPVN